MRRPPSFHNSAALFPSFAQKFVTSFTPQTAGTAGGGSTEGPILTIHEQSCHRRLTHPSVSATFSALLYNQGTVVAINDGHLTNIPVTLAAH